MGNRLSQTWSISSGGSWKTTKQILKAEDARRNHIWPGREQHRQRMRQRETGLIWGINVQLEHRKYGIWLSIEGETC